MKIEPMLHLSGGYINKGDIFMHGNPQQALRYAYIAGLIDGEGSFIVGRSKGKAAMKDRINPIYKPQIRIGMISKDAINYIRDNFPGIGYMYEEGVRKDRPSNRPMFRWEVNKREDVIKIIDSLSPYLLVKLENAKLLKEFCLAYTLPKRRGIPIESSELQKREDFYQKMKKLNGSGAVATTN